jgi:hypothetical protein
LALCVFLKQMVRRLAAKHNREDGFIIRAGRVSATEEKRSILLINKQP